MLRWVVVFTAIVIAAAGGLALLLGDGWREPHWPSGAAASAVGKLALLLGDARREPHWASQVEAWAAGRLALLHEDGRWKPHWPSQVEAWAARRLALLHGNGWRQAHRPSEVGARVAGLGPDVATLTVMRHHGVRTLSTADANQALALIRDILPAAGPLTPVPDGPRFLANLRLNEQLVDITLGVPQSLIVGSRQIPAVSGLVIPFTGEWRQRIVVLQTGQVEVSGPLVNVDLIDLEGIVEKEDGNP
jgi:hypothetical protein